MNKKALQVATAVICTLTLFFVGYFLMQANSARAAELVSWTDFYQIIAFVGAVVGFSISASWGGFQSTLGRSLFFISLGLFFQNIGQTIYSIYGLIFHISNIYPSYADIGFFGSIPFYIYGTYLLGKVCGMRLSLRSYHGKAFAFLLPVVIVGVSYALFLKDYQFDYSNPVKIFLDFGYPIGQATYISLAILAFVFSKDFLGGVMKNTILLLIVALCVQYFADFNFLFQSGNDSWMNSGYGDLLYLVSYSFMSFALIQFGAVFSKIRNTQ